MVSAMVFLSVTGLIWTNPPGLTRIENQWRSLIEKTQGAPFGEAVLAVASIYAGYPYEEKTLDRSDREELVAYLDGFDCVTLVENSLALARLLRAPNSSLARYPAELQKIRYRGGKIQGYCSRLHYTSDWAFDNQQKGVLIDITEQIGGVRAHKPLDFMTRNREAYRQLSDNNLWREMKEIEARINTRPTFYIPKQAFAAVESRVENGDIIAITTTVRGLDLVHVGIAVKKERVYLLHASSQHQRVVVTDQPLSEYLAKRNSHSGVMVFRAIDPGAQ